jgi:hypothetical protein
LVVNAAWSVSFWEAGKPQVGPLALQLIVPVSALPLQPPKPWPVFGVATILIGSP